MRGTETQVPRFVWLWVGGCFIVSVLILVVVGLLGFAAYRVVTERAQPTVRLETFQEMAPDWAFFPGAQFDSLATNQPLYRLIPSLIDRPLGESTYLVVSFRCDDDRDSVIKWYEKELSKRGWVAQRLLIREEGDFASTVFKTLGIGPDFARGGEACFLQFPPGYKG
ncbi:MAG: hypothetical protein NZ959_12025, partial [Armatimonadetes bacterium]|nr:hypothetical protein [Armatimonadota bacterium]MDW8122577.1 hypothetical protein [Armatimonadota bacterium]